MTAPHISHSSNGTASDSNAHNIRHLPWSGDMSGTPTGCREAGEIDPIGQIDSAGVVDLDHLKTLARHRVSMNGVTIDRSMLRSLDKFWARVNPTASGCWLWSGRIAANGYGRYGAVQAGLGRVNATNLAHRHVWCMLRGPIPAGLEIDHLCRVRHCVNPDHLEVVTHAVNIERRHHYTTSVCPHGHPKNGADLYINPNTGHRTCKGCTKAATAAWLAKDGNREKQNAIRKARKLGTICRRCGRPRPLDLLGFCVECGDIAPPFSRTAAVPSTAVGNEAASPVASSTQHQTNEGRRGIAPPDGPTTRGGTPHVMPSD